MPTTTAAPPADVPRQPPLLRVLHWLVALLVLIVLPVGIIIKFVKDEASGAFYLVHESLGFLILWLMLARLAARLLRPAPSAPWLTPFERGLSKAVHWLLYAALILQPILGFLMTNAFGFPLAWFGLITIPSPLGEDPSLAPLLKEAHVLLGWAIVVLFLLHIAGVLRHHLLKRDPTLYRIL